MDFPIHHGQYYSYISILEVGANDRVVRPSSKICLRMETNESAALLTQI